jgi:hypothetical protein
MSLMATPKVLLDVASALAFAGETVSFKPDEPWM